MVASAYLDLQADQSGTATVEIAPHTQTLSIVNPRPFTVIATLAIPLARHTAARTHVVVADSGVTGGSNGSGAITHTLTVPSKKGIVYSLSATYDDPPQDNQGSDLTLATATDLAVLTVTTYNGVGLSPTDVTRFPLQTAVLGDIDDTRLGDGTNRRYDGRQFVYEFFNPIDQYEAQQQQDWFESGRRNFKHFMDLYDWAVAEGFTGV